MTTTVPPALRVSAWRDHDPAVRTLRGMSLGELDVTGTPAEAARSLWDAGARRVELPGTVDLAGGAPAARALWQLQVVRDLTACAVWVDWRIALDERTDWRSLSHLQPPAAVSGTGDDEEATRRWRHEHYLGKCLWRRGPGFVQIRDRRWGALHRFTVEETDYQEAIDTLACGTPAGAVPPAVLADLAGEHLVTVLDGHACFLPYRVNRWAQAPMTL